VNTRPRTRIPVNWPDPPLNIVLVEPDIPQNTGNIARLCAATGSVLHLIDPLGFQLTDRAVKRAGLDYWDAVTIVRHASWDSFLQTGPKRLFFFSTSGKRNYARMEYRPGDYLVFGSESKGLPLDLLAQHSENVLNIPIRLESVRSLNLASAAAVVLYEALRLINQA